MWGIFLILPRKVFSLFFFCKGSIPYPQIPLLLFPPLKSSLPVSPFEKGGEGDLEISPNPSLRKRGEIPLNLPFIKGEV